MNRFSELLATAQKSYPKHVWELVPTDDEQYELYVIFVVKPVGNNRTSLSVDRVQQILGEEFSVGDEVLLQVFPSYSEYLDPFGVQVPMVH